MSWELEQRQFALAGPEPRTYYIAWAQYRFGDSLTVHLMEWWAPDLPTARRFRLEQTDILARSGSTVTDAGITHIATSLVEDAYGQKLT